MTRVPAQCAISGGAVQFAVFYRWRGHRLARLRLPACALVWHMHMRHLVTAVQVPHGFKHCWPWIGVSNGTDQLTLCIEFSIPNSQTTRAWPLAVAQPGQHRMSPSPRQLPNHLPFNYRSVVRGEMKSCLALQWCWMHSRTPCSVFAADSVASLGGRLELHMAVTYSTHAWSQLIL